MLILLKPGHEYTGANAKFGVSVLPTGPVKALQSFAQDNKETQGRFTIGDEKKHNVFMRPQVRNWCGRTLVALVANPRAGP
jgi:hydroxyacylglutathione hydrolase